MTTTPEVRYIAGIYGGILLTEEHPELTVGDSVTLTVTAKVLPHRERPGRVAYDLDVTDLLAVNGVQADTLGTEEADRLARADQLAADIRSTRLDAERLRADVANWRADVAENLARIADIRAHELARQLILATARLNATSTPRRLRRSKVA